MWACRTFVRWAYDLEDEGTVHRVSLITPRDPRLGVRFGYACTCNESRNETGPCVHVLIAMGHHCGWHEMYDPEIPVGEKCPRCECATVEVSYTPA